MGIKKAYSDKKDLSLLGEDLKQQIGETAPQLLLFFASSIFPPQELAALMQETFPHSLVIGCTTAGEIISGAMLKESVVAMAFDHQIITSAKAVVLKNLSQITTEELKPAFEIFSEYFGIEHAQMSTQDYLGMVLVDGLSQSEEKLMDCIGNLSNLMFVGGSAGDDLKFQKTHVFAHGQAYTNAAILLLLKPAQGFELLKTQSFSSSKQCLVATKVNESHREVIEFNHEPASLAYAKALNILPEEAADHFMDHPVGLLIENEPYVRSPQQIQNDRMLFYCQVKEGMELYVLDGEDIVADTRRALENKIAEKGKSPRAIINFNCILRTLELESKSQTQLYADLFKEIPTIGFSTYGEQYIGHINQTATMILLY